MRSTPSQPYRHHLSCLVAKMTFVTCKSDVHPREPEPPRGGATRQLLCLVAGVQPGRRHASDRHRERQDPLVERQLPRQRPRAAMFPGRRLRHPRQVGSVRAARPVLSQYLPVTRYPGPDVILPPPCRIVASLQCYADGYGTRPSNPADLIRIRAVRATRSGASGARCTQATIVSHGARLKGVIAWTRIFALTCRSSSSTRLPSTLDCPHLL